MVKLENMSFYARHGCLESEKFLGGRFSVDLSYDYPMLPAAQSDDISKAVDYSAVYKIVKEQMAIPSNLLENVAWRILQSIKSAFPEIIAAKVTVTKFNPPLDGPTASSSVTMTF